MKHTNSKVVCLQRNRILDHLELLAAV